MGSASPMLYYAFLLSFHRSSQAANYLIYYNWHMVVLLFREFCMGDISRAHVPHTSVKPKATNRTVGVCTRQYLL